MFHRVLVGYDGSPAARSALRVAIALAADLHTDIHVLIVIRPPAHTETDEEREVAAAAERDNLSKGLSDHAGDISKNVDVSVDVVHADDPAQAIADFVDRYGFDLVVVGRHGREQLTHRGIGQSLEGLLRRHPCPVLVV